VDGNNSPVPFGGPDGKEWTCDRNRVRISLTVGLLKLEQISRDIPFVTESLGAGSCGEEPTTNYSWVRGVMHAN